MEDTGQGSVLRAGAITYNNNTGFGIARLDPRLEITPQEGRRALSVESDSMELYAEKRQAVAIGNVHIRHGDTEGEAAMGVGEGVGFLEKWVVEQGYREGDACFALSHESEPHPPYVEYVYIKFEE